VNEERNMNFGTVIAGIVMDFVICLVVATNFLQDVHVAVAIAGAVLLSCVKFCVQVGVVTTVRTVFKV
jgi:hypothetical protein